MNLAQSVIYAKKLLDKHTSVRYIMYMQKIHVQKSPRIPIGKPFEVAIKEILFPLTNTGNLSRDWNVTDWVRYAIAEQLRKEGALPDDCQAMLKRFYKDKDGV